MEKPDITPEEQDEKIKEDINRLVEIIRQHPSQKLVIAGLSSVHRHLLNETFLSLQQQGENFIAPDLIEDKREKTIDDSIHEIKANLEKLEAPQIYIEEKELPQWHRKHPNNLRRTRKKKGWE